MSVIWMSLVFYVNPDYCDTYEKSVLIALADHANGEGKSIYPSVAHLAWKCSMSARGVQKIIDRLCEKRLLKIVKNGGGSRANTYALNSDAIKAISVNPDDKPWKKTGEPDSPPDTGEPDSPRAVNPVRTIHYITII